ncbi:MAG: hypothetical protein ACHQXA_07835 [Gemmatimonadales bacterium]
MIEARTKGKTEFHRLLVVDRDPGCRASVQFAGVIGVELVAADWDGFFDGYLEAAPAGELDVIIPSPLMPHLFFNWLVRRARVRWPDRVVSAHGLSGRVGTPYERQGGDGSSYLSFADWLCPTHCTEPALCPVIRAPRTWEMGEALADYCRSSGTAGPALFTVKHLVHGVGGFSVAAILAAEATLIQTIQRGGSELVVGTVSSCHGAAGVLAVGRAGTAKR